MEEHTITILLLGDEKSGKSTFLSSVSLIASQIDTQHLHIPWPWLTPRRRISQGRQSLNGKTPINLLRDMDQPFIFEVRSRKGQYRFEFHDTSSPESWRLLRPDLVIICYDISQRLSLVNLQRVVCPRSKFLP
jgi:GTPase SAR1 family protein